MFKEYTYDEFRKYFKYSCLSCQYFFLATYRESDIRKCFLQQRLKQIFVHKEHKVNKTIVPKSNDCEYYESRWYVF